MTAPLLQTLADGLPRLRPQQAALQRVAFDARFERWLQERFNDPDLRVARATGAVTGATRIEVGWAGGSVVLESDLSGRPAAQLLLGAGDPSLACALAQAILQPGFEQVADVVAAARVISVASPVAPQPSAEPVALGADTVPLIVTAGTTVALHAGAGEGYDGWRETIVAIAPDVDAARRLRLPGYLRLFERCLPASTLANLGRGDVLLVDAAAGAPRLCGVLRFGTGVAMQMPVEIDENQPHANVTSTPELVADEDGGGLADALPEALSELMLPVAFEVETTALSLSELASIRPGYVVELSTPLTDAAVRMVCHGQVVGSGQLIAIGDHLGVRILRIAINRHDAAAQR
jgi:type III secretion protein Q